MTASIFVVTYARDLPFMRMCARSITKFATGFQRVVIVVPTQDYAAFMAAFSACTTADGAPFQVRHRYEPPDRQACHRLMNGTKCCADLYCPDAEMIAHIDADCIFNQPVTPASYLDDQGRIKMLVAPYELAGDARTWKALVDRALGVDAKLEVMQSPVLAYLVGNYRGVREHIERLHHEPFIDHCLTYWVPEFDTMGHYALMTKPELYAPILRASPEGEAFNPIVAQSWSHWLEKPDCPELTAAMARFEAILGL